MVTSKQALVHNGLLKLSALALSIFLWALVQTEPSNRETFTAVPVSVHVADPAWTTSAVPSPSQIDVRLGGTARDIIRLAREGMSIRVPVASVGSRDTVISLRREWVDLGESTGLIVESMVPSAIRVSLEQAQTRLIPVATRFVGRVHDQLALSAPIEVNPRVIRVRGPRSSVMNIDSLRLVALDWSDVARSGVYTVAVDTIGLLGTSVVPMTATLGVRLEDRVERVLDGISVQAIANPGEPELIVNPAIIQVRLAGARTLVTSLVPERLLAWVPTEYLQGLTPGEERVVSVRIEGVPSLVTVVPGNERITVRRVLDRAELTGGSQ